MSKAQWHDLRRKETENQALQFLIGSIILPAPFCHALFNAIFDCFWVSSEHILNSLPKDQKSYALTVGIGFFCLGLGTLRRPLKMKWKNRYSEAYDMKHIIEWLQ